VKAAVDCDRQAARDGCAVRQFRGQELLDSPGRTIREADEDVGKPSARRRGRENPSGSLVVYSIAAHTTAEGSA
jgi:hypothetical protein